MLKIYLSFLYILTISSYNAVALKFEGSRIDLWINPNSVKNDIFHEPLNVTVGSKDISIKWSRGVWDKKTDREFLVWQELNLVIDYKGKHDKLNAYARICKNSNLDDDDIIAQTFFQIMITGAKMEKKCPIGQEGPTKSPGKINTEIKKRAGVHCGTPATVILTIIRNIFGITGTTIGYTKADVLKIRYSGKFSGC